MGIGIPISQLPEITVPFTGSEELAIVQNNITQAAPLSSLLNYLQPQLGVTYLLNNSTNWQNTYLTVNTKDSLWSDTAFSVSTLSGNWQTTYSTVNNLSSTWDGDFCGEVVKLDRVEACGEGNAVKLDGNLRVENGWIGLSGTDYGYGLITASNTSGGIGLAGTLANAINGGNGADFYVDNGGRSFARNNLSIKTTDTTDSLVVGSGNIRVNNGYLRISSGSLPNDWGFIGQGSDSSGIGLAASVANFESTEFLPHLYVAGLGNSIGNVGINTTVAEPPMEKLDVRGNLQVGLSGVDANLIKFYGTFGDGLEAGGLNPIGTHTVIGERRYDKQTKEEASELILFKGDNPDETYGPDRVRARAAEIVFQTFEAPDRETYDTMQDNNTRLIIKNDGKIGIGTDTPTTDLEVNGQIKITGGTPGANKVLISDETGLASWSDATGSGTNVTVAVVAPSTPSNGDLWFNSEAANLYVFYVEGVQGYWVEASSAGWVSTYGPLSANWNSAFTTVSVNSASWVIDTDTIYDDSLLQATSGTWDSTYNELANIGLAGNNITNADVISANTIHSISAFTHYQDILVSELSGFSVEGDVSIAGQVDVTGTLSANDIVYALDGDSAQWNSSYTTVQSESSNWVSTLPTLDSVTDNGSATLNDISVGRIATLHPTNVGLNNSATGQQSAAIGGRENNANGIRSTAFGGRKNTVSGTDSTAVGGTNQSVIGVDSEALGSVNLKLFSKYASAVGAANSTIGTLSGVDPFPEDRYANDSVAKHSIILGGENIEIQHAVHAATVGGDGNRIQTDDHRSVILGGTGITTDAADTAYVPNLNVGAGFKMPTGAGDSYVLTSDANGVGTWQANIDALQIAASDETTDLTTGITTTMRAPYAMELTDVRASVTTAPIGADITVDVTANGTTIFSTIISIDDGSKTSVGSASPRVISTTSIPDDAEIKVDIKTVGSTTIGAGLKLSLIGYKS